VIKIDLHMHSGEDPEDGLHYPATAIIDRAVELGYSAISITLHGKVLDDPRVIEYAARKGLLLIPAIEWKIRGRDILLYNLTQREAEDIRTYDDLRAFRRERGENFFTVAPHPYYPVGHSLRHDVVRHLDCFDAIEHSQVHLTWLNFNQQALATALEHGKPVIANSDAHALWMFGQHYTLVEAEPTISSIFKAIREDRLKFYSPAITVWECLKLFVVDPLLHRKKGRITHSFPPKL
jgi:predicted metal-dependent phosphoesterase TrpH